MAEIIEMPSAHSGWKIQEGQPEKFYIEFSDLQERARAMVAINELRKSSPEIFVGEQSYKVDENRSKQGLELAFKDTLSDRAGKILNELHARGIKLNLTGGNEEQIYRTAA